MGKDSLINGVETTGQPHAKKKKKRQKKKQNTNKPLAHYLTLHPKINSKESLNSCI